MRQRHVMLLDFVACVRECFVRSSDVRPLTLVHVLACLSSHGYVSGAAIVRQESKGSVGLSGFFMGVDKFFVPFFIWTTLWAISMSLACLTVSTYTCTFVGHGCNSNCKDCRAMTQSRHQGMFQVNDCRTTSSSCLETHGDTEEGRGGMGWVVVMTGEVCVLEE